ncbi:MAG: GCN5-related N-acetyltransferase [Herbinix sp.]|nr:GCN5-related N-acetyltransferase [Herbinix sp.]
METERLIIRRFQENDWKDLYDYLSLEEVVKYEPYEVFTKEQCMEEASYRSNNEAFWAVCLKENNKVIGNLYFAKEGPEEFRTWELGYVFNPKFGGRGYATEACKDMLQHAFKEYSAHRIIGRCNPQNTASWKLLERLGMRREGHFIKPVFFKRDIEGQPIWHDAYEYAILAEEWFAIHK